MPKRPRYFRHIRLHIMRCFLKSNRMKKDNYLRFWMHYTKNIKYLFSRIYFSLFILLLFFFFLLTFIETFSLLQIRNLNLWNIFVRVCVRRINQNFILRDRDVEPPENFVGFSLKPKHDWLFASVLVGTDNFTALFSYFLLPSSPSAFSTRWRVLPQLSWDLLLISWRPVNVKFHTD